MSNRICQVVAWIVITAACAHTHAAITYTYDAQHRLVQASYSSSEKVFCNYDAAGNVDQYVAVTDAKHLESWLLYFSMTEPWSPRGRALFAGAEKPAPQR